MPRQNLVKPKRLELLVPADLLRRIDEWRGRLPTPVDRSDAARRLMIAGLDRSDAMRIQGGAAGAEAANEGDAL